MSSSRVTKVLWICNLILPRIAVSLGLGFIPKEGWVEGLFGELVSERVKGSLDFLPDIALARALGKGHDIPLGKEKALAYLAGETFPLDGDDGFRVVSYCGIPLGFVKLTKGVAKNHYPKGLRRDYR